MMTSLIIAGAMMIGAGVKGLIDRPAKPRQIIKHPPTIWD